MNFYQSRINKLHRHVYVFNRHITPRKIINILSNELELKSGKKILKSKPYALKIETTVLCNLKCPGCFRTESALEGREKNMSFENYKKYIDPLVPYLLEISLYDQGEPLIQPNIITFLKYNAEKNIGTILSSNFAMKLTDQKLEQLITSGLDYLIVAIDGVKQETYEKYRVGGRLDEVLGNVKKIIALKNKLRTKRPYIEWQMIDFTWNKNEQEKAKQMAHQLGFDFFNIVLDGYSINRDENYKRKSRCPVLWNTLTIEFDGLVSACYVNDHESLYTGDLNKQNFEEIWNSREYQFLRGTHNNKQKGAQFSFCKRCEMFDRA